MGDSSWAKKKLEETLGKTIAEQTQKITFDQKTAWEHVLRLHIRPRPSWCPEPLWVKVVNLVLVTSEEIR